MLSICIPVYNCHVSMFVGNLRSLMEKITAQTEIILIDDASGAKFQESNKQLAKFDNVDYFQLKKNIGRAKIRNLFLAYVNFDYLLFLDCDSEITGHKFIENYLTQISYKHLVMCGGRIYPDKIPPKTHYLRQKYGIDRECMPANKRRRAPYRSFMTNNFVIHVNVLSKILFDERLSHYGHEDTLFGYRLKQNKIPIAHIDNPVQHLYTESNAEFVQKTVLGLKSLVKIREFINDKGFDNELKLLRMYSLTRKLRLGFFLSVFYVLFNPIIKWLILKNIGGLLLFDFYKLLVFGKLNSESSPKKQKR